VTLPAENQQPRLIVCSNCGRPLRDHCRKHFDPCCPGHCTGTKRGVGKWSQ